MYLCIQSKIVMLSNLRHTYCSLSQNCIVNVKKMKRDGTDKKQSRRKHTFDIILAITLCSKKKIQCERFSTMVTPYRNRNWVNIFYSLL